jgi:hypothetical protein
MNKIYLILSNLHEILTNHLMNFRTVVKPKSLLIVSLVLLLTACGVLIEKRRFNKGYHVELLSKKRSFSNQHKEEDLGKGNNQMAEVPDNSFSSAQGLQDFSADNAQRIKSREEKSKDLHYDTKKSESIKHLKKDAQTSAMKDDFAGNGVEMLHQRVTISENKQQEQHSGDGYLFGLMGGMFALSFATIRLTKKRSMRISRWANRNKGFSRFAIFSGHSIVSGMGWFVGDSMGAMGLDLSTGSQYALGSSLMLSSLYLFIIERKGLGFASWGSFFKHRMGHLITGISLFGLMMGTGNHFQTNKDQVSIIGQVVSTFSNPESEKNTDTLLSEEISSKEKAPQGGNGAAIAGAILLSLVVVLLTAILACAAACDGQALLALAVVFLGIGLIVLIWVTMMSPSRGVTRGVRYHSE